MKQTVKKAAKEYADRQYGPEDKGVLYRETINDFIAGAEWQAKQSPWISIEDKFPEENTGVIFLVDWGKNRYGYFVGVYYGNGCWESDHWVFLPNSNIGKVTHWMPLPKKRDE